MFGTISELDSEIVLLCMIQREAESLLRTLAHEFKAVAVVGPRQSGKTTLVRSVFADKPYVSLENPDVRAFATQDMRSFLAQFPLGAVLDEAQRAPELFSYLQQILDDSPERGRFILTGSNNFLLQENISQSLAGRIAYLNLLPFTLNELPPDAVSDSDEWMLKGGYPAIHDGRTGRANWFANYVRTYVERDVRQIRNITDLFAFERFMRLCAGRTGQLLNLSNLAVEAGVDSKTIASWIGVLESSFIIHLLRPFHVNFNKRVVKMPKLLFLDTGLACALMGITERNQLALHPMRGALFENLVTSELIKRLGHQGRIAQTWFWRDHKGHEVDLLIEEAGRTTPIEIKSGRTIQPEFFAELEYWTKLSGETGSVLIHGGDARQERSNGVRVLPWNGLFEAISI
jgi:predicted AAA+ superfamily ATPase